jgi:hypothetical protein
MLWLVAQALFLLSALSPAAAGRTSMRAQSIRPDTQSAPAEAEEPVHVKPLSNVGLDDQGVLSLLQMTSEERERYKAEMHESTGVKLFHVNINMDIEQMNTAGGITMCFDKQQQRLRLDEGLDGAAGISWGFYVDSIAANGWSQLWMYATPSANVQNDVKMYAAGYIEGVLTSVRLSQYQANYHHSLLRAEKTWHALDAIRKELKIAAGFLKVKSNLLPHLMPEESASKYWRYARYYTFQLWGMLEGYNYVAEHFNVHQLDMIDLLFLNSGGEMATMMLAFSPSALADRITEQITSKSFLQMGMHFRKLRGTHAKVRAAKHLHSAIERYKVKKGLVSNTTNKTKTRLRGFAHFDDLPKHVLNDTLGPESLLQGAGRESLDDMHWEARMAYDGHCSAYVRVTDGFGDMFTAHNTWGDYTQMTRVWKYYDFPIKNGDMMAKNIGFSSYPGAISSMDDFYQMDSGLVVVDTTLEILDPFIWDFVIDRQVSGVMTVPNFMHIMIANKMAKTPQHWTALYNTKNSGTYNVQWMVVDYNNFIPGKPVADNVFWVLETMPALTHAEDLSHRLRSHGYWGAYNRPYFMDIRKKTKFDKAQKKLGNLYSWQDNPRAVIFKGLAGVNAIPDARNMIYRNKYPLAGIAPNTPGHEISARFDLSPMTAFPNGGIDAKLTSKCLFGLFATQIVSGPVHTDVPVFSWKNDDGTEKWPGFAHTGQPDTWNFGWIQMTPNGAGAPLDVCR